MFIFSTNGRKKNLYYLLINFKIRFSLVFLIKGLIFLQLMDCPYNCWIILKDETIFTLILFVITI